MGRFEKFIEYQVRVKEYNNESVLMPSYVCMPNKSVDVPFLIEFFGLENPDVEWYQIYAHNFGKDGHIKSRKLLASTKPTNNTTI